MLLYPFMYSSLLECSAVLALFMNTSKACPCVMDWLASARQAAARAANKAVLQLPCKCPASARASAGTLTYSNWPSGSQDAVPCAGQLLQTLKGHGSAVTCLKFSRHTNLLLSGSFDKAAIVWQADTGVQMQRITAHAGMHVDMNHLVTCRNDADTFSSSWACPTCTVSPVVCRFAYALSLLKPACMKALKTPATCCMH